MYVVVACENRRIFRLLLFFDRVNPSPSQMTGSVSQTVFFGGAKQQPQNPSVFAGYVRVCGPGKLQSVRHRILKWARFLFLLFSSYFWGVDFRSYADWLACRQYTIDVIWRRTKCGRVKCACLPWLYGLFVRTLISRTNAYAGCGRPTLNFIEHLDLGRSVPTAKPLHLKMFCILCRDTSKASSLSIVWVPWSSKTL